ncbi:hypothetical protein F442_10257 [Phytophthora nicotianae P10297]|uniref:BZIP domain-containing protein n=1 Tax=Phytophthora nicotianae P10297 TaxID=1317064 RepID=W2Z6G8_PHYNI|nr:hypothetical protein F442_10257 [Phytophthora nicotianae P10297]
MASPTQNWSCVLSYQRKPLADRLVGVIQPRSLSSRHHAHRKVVAAGNLWFPLIENVRRGIDDGNLSSGISSVDSSSKLVNWRQPNVINVSEGDNREMPAPDFRDLDKNSILGDKATELPKPLTSCEKNTKRLERCRINQKRYRERQRAIRSSIEQIMIQINTLTRKQRHLTKRKESRDPCRVVGDMFNQLEAYFRLLGCRSDKKVQLDRGREQEMVESMKNSFVFDVVLGDVNGVDAVMELLHRNSQYFDDPTVHLKQLEEVSSGIVTASATLHVTISVSTLCFLFPRLLRTSLSKHCPPFALGKRLLGEQLECECSITFFFDKASGRVARLQTSINWIGALFRVLGNLKEVSNVLDGALIDV